ncbi:Metallo-dependent phosphatase [Teratosphaeria nubilosa]|uniref:Metallo-dependent phosphatase n=1 Tax=Teratosphaeria nubilosa TaxID=161662 RepID=A0A6G1LMZ9_9PEZI|nr:Metallo-dependent phosphatase [Teratosphaeria nubilosa]
MNTITDLWLYGALCFITSIITTLAAPTDSKRDVDTRYPYTGPQIPVGDWVDSTVNGNGKGFIRLTEPPAVPPAPPPNSINVISLAFIPDGMAIHFQNALGLDGPPTVHWGAQPDQLCHTTRGYSTTYDRTPPCSLAVTTMCSQFFHNVLLRGLKPGTTYYYSIPASNGTTPSPTLKFTMAPATESAEGFSLAILADMGYINARDTHKHLAKAVDDGIAFAWHGGDISYADNWSNGVLSCDPSITWAVCYNGSDSMLFNTPPAKFTPDYNIPVPDGQNPNQGGPYGGDASPLYETNWDIWQQWLNPVTMRVPYMVLPGNHEASCSEGDGFGNGTNNTMTAYLDNGVANGTAEKSALTYYSCPPSQRNFTAYQHRFRMPGPESGGVGNFWYSFDHGNAHFISLDAETDIPNSLENPFLRDLTGNETRPTANETTVTEDIVGADGFAAR